VLAAGDAGQILRVDHRGRAASPVQVPQRAIHRLIAAEWPSDRPTVCLGLSYAPEGHIVAVGLNGDLQEAWSYRLPAGAHDRELQFATSCRLFGAEGGQWLLAGPDGSVHWISDDGDFFDYFNTGAAISALAATQEGEANYLFVAGDNGLQAWSVRQPK
jgi:hypothetical protein